MKQKNNISHNLKICLFGTYLRDYSRNITLIEGLKRNHMDMIEVHKEPLVERLDRPQDLTLKTIMRRIIYKIKLYGFFFKSYKKIKSADKILVLYPSHLVLPVAWVLGKILKKEVLFDSLITLYDSLVLDKHIVPMDSLQSRIVLFVEKILLSMPDKIIADTELMKIFFEEKFKISSDKIFVVPIGTNDKLYKPKEKMRGKSLTILFFGYYNPLQGAIYIIRAAKLLKDNTKIQFLMIGDGVMKKDVVNFAEKNKLKNVSFLSIIPEKKLVRYIQKSDIMLGIFSNISTAQRVIPNKMFAAIACKKALISAQLPSMNKYFKHEKNIYFCKSENPESLARAIVELSGNHKKLKRIGSNGYELYIKSFSPSSIGKILINNL